MREKKHPDKDEESYKNRSTDEYFFLLIKRDLYRCSDPPAWSDPLLTRHAGLFPSGKFFTCMIKGEAMLWAENPSTIITGKCGTPRYLFSTYFTIHEKLPSLYLNRIWYHKYV